MNPPPNNPSVKALHAYFWWLGLSMIAYVITIIFSRNYLYAHHLANPWRIVVALLPLIPVIGIFAAMVRYTLATDELQRQIIVNSSALAGGVTALLAVTYGLIEGDGIPHLSAWWAYIVFMISYMIAASFVRRHYR
jgi:O-antigen/teichoic acid export membrane protein